MCVHVLSGIENVSFDGRGIFRSRDRECEASIKRINIEWVVVAVDERPGGYVRKFVFLWTECKGMVRCTLQILCFRYVLYFRIKPGYVLYV